MLARLSDGTHLPWRWDWIPPRQGRCRQRLQFANATVFWFPCAVEPLHQPVAGKPWRAYSVASMVRSNGVSSRTEDRPSRWAASALPRSAARRAAPLLQAGQRRGCRDVSAADAVVSVAPPRAGASLIALRPSVRVMRQPPARCQQDRRGSGELDHNGTSWLVCSQTVTNESTMTPIVYRASCSAPPGERPRRSRPSRGRQTEPDLAETTMGTRTLRKPHLVDLHQVSPDPRDLPASAPGARTRWAAACASAAAVALPACASTMAALYSMTSCRATS